MQTDRMLLDKDVKRILTRMEENTKTECIYIKTKISPSRLPLTCSKFGGIPYWPNNRGDYPKTANGIPLTLLAQINLSDLPENSIFPKKGILQFFIWNLTDWDNYRVVFHKDCDIPASPYLKSLPTSLMPESAELTKETGEKVTVPNLFWGDDGMFPIVGEMALEFSKRYEPVNTTENCFEAEFRKAAKQVGISLAEDFDVFDALPKEVLNKYYESSGGHKLLGRPCFVQYDYRESKADDILLFQMDSAWDSGEKDEQHYINFGDAGTAGFFIKEDGLKNLDFSRVYYDWQCY